eukprot:SAG22_NODE_1374_length_4563_cov_1.852823_8_plen_275_part_01
MSLIPMFADSKQFLNKTETVDKSGPKLPKAAAPPASTQADLMAMIPHFADSKSMLNKVEVNDRSAPQVGLKEVELADDGEAPPGLSKMQALAWKKMHAKELEEATAAAAGAAAGGSGGKGKAGGKGGGKSKGGGKGKCKGAAPPPPAPAPSGPAAAGGGGDAQADLMSLIPMFADSKQFLNKTETVDKSAPKLPKAAAPPVVRGHSRVTHAACIALRLLGLCCITSPGWRQPGMVSVCAALRWLGLMSCRFDVLLSSWPVWLAGWLACRRRRPT